MSRSFVFFFSHGIPLRDNHRCGVEKVRGLVFCVGCAYMGRVSEGRARGVASWLPEALPSMKQGELGK